MSNTKPTELAKALRDLAAMVEANPDLADRLTDYTFARVLVWTNNRNEVADFARAGAKAGATVAKHQDDKWAGVDVVFGPMRLHVYIDRNEVCDRVVVGTETVVEKGPDPEAVAALPVVEREVEREIVEWRCRPLLADETSETVGASA